MDILRQFMLQEMYDDQTNEMKDCMSFIVKIGQISCKLKLNKSLRMNTFPEQ